MVSNCVVLFCCKLRVSAVAGLAAVAIAGFCLAAGALAADGKAAAGPAAAARAIPTADHPTNPAVRARLKSAGPAEKVVELDLSNADLSDADLACLTRLPNLEKLSLAGNHDITCKGIAYLAALPKLRCLDIAGTKKCIEGVVTVKSLEQLQLVVGFRDWSDLRALAGLTNLRELDLAIANAGDVALAGLDNLSQLQVLRLAAQDVSDAGFSHLKGLRNLEELDLSGSRRVPNITGASLDSLAGLPKLRRLSIGDSGISDDGIAHAAGLRQLESLDVTFCRITDAGLKNLRGLTNLRELNLYATQIGDAGLGSLKAMHQLRKLNVGGTKVTSDGMETVGQLESLEELDLGGTKITQATRERKAAPAPYDPFSSPPPPGPEIVEVGSRPALAQLKNLTRLRKLGLARIARFDGDGLDQLAGLAQLAQLDVSDDPISVAGQKQLLTLPHLETLIGTGLGLDAERIDLQNLRGLRSLDMRRGWGTIFSFRPGMQFPHLRELRLTSQGVGRYAVALGSLTQLPALRELELGSPALDDAGIREQTGLGQVETLVLDAPKVTDNGLKFLDGWKNLKALTLHCQLTDAGLATIARLSELRKLTIADTWVTDAGLKRLTALQTLRRLDITNTACTPAGVAALQSALPDCEIISGGPAPPPPRQFVVPDGWIQ